MIHFPYRFEEGFTDADFAKIGVLMLRWAHIDHILGNCLKVLLRLTDDEAVTMVFPLGAAERIERIKRLAKKARMRDHSREPFEELAAVMTGLHYVRNTVAHAVAIEDEDGGHSLHLRSKMRSLTKEQVLSTEELTNYASHLVLAFRYSLGFKNELYEHDCPARPVVPDFLQRLIPAKTV